MTTERERALETPYERPFLHSMTFDQMQAVQNVWRMIGQCEIAQGRVCTPDEMDEVFAKYDVRPPYQQLRPHATLHVATDRHDICAKLLPPNKWIERAIYHLPDPQEDRMSYERAIADVTNHTFLLHAQAEPGIGIVFDARTIGLISETPGPSRVKIVRPESWTIA